MGEHNRVERFPRHETFAFGSVRNAVERTELRVPHKGRTGHGASDVIVVHPEERHVQARIVPNESKWLLSVAFETYIFAGTSPVRI